MNYNNPKLLDELAAQYALGTLRGGARRRFRRICQRDRSALAAVRRWEDHLVDLAATIAPEQPSAAVWQKIQQRLGHGSVRSRGGVGRWGRVQWAVAASVVLLIGAITWWTLVVPPAAQLVATITDQQQTQLWRIEAPQQREELHVVASAALPKDAQHAYELWALPKRPGAAPVSLGLMPQAGERALQLNAAQRLALAGAEKVAISLEPVGGSPTGAPTGPVLFVASVVSNG
jgi:anti-sigma-K factor RskA